MAFWFVCEIWAPNRAERLDRHPGAVRSLSLVMWIICDTRVHSPQRYGQSFITNLACSQTRSIPTKYLLSAPKEVFPSKIRSDTFLTYLYVIWVTLSQLCNDTLVVYTWSACVHYDQPIMSSVSSSHGGHFVSRLSG